MGLRLGLLSALATAVVAAAVGASALSASTAKRSNGDRLTGTWVATVIRPAPLPPLGHAKQIGAEVDARYPGLRVSETSSTGVIESLTLFDAGVDPRVVPADNGIYFAVCPIGASCPYPGRAARPATGLAPRRVALELAARTFVETSANLVVVCLPTRRFILLVFERDALDARDVLDSLAGHPPADRSLQLRGIVDVNTLPHLYAPFALSPTAGGRDSLLALPVALTG